MDYIPLLTTLLATALYLNTLPANFAYDDSRAIQKNPDLLPETPLWNLFYDDFWGTPLTHSGSHKSYRPLCVLTFRLNYMLGKMDPWGYHLGNVICHAITTFIFTLLAQTLLGSRLGSATAGLLFAAHPIHTEAVAGIVGRADVLACIFFLLTILCYMKYTRVRNSTSPGSRWLLAVLVLLLTAAAMLNKEQALTVLAVCATYDVFVAHRASVRDILTLRIFTQVRFRSILEGLILLTIYGSSLLGFRIYFMGNKPPEFAPSDNPASDSDSLLTRVLTYNYLPAANFWMVVCPSVLSFDWSMESVPLLESLMDIRNLFTLLFYAGCLWLLVKVSLTLEHGGNTCDMFNGNIDKLESTHNIPNRTATDSNIRITSRTNQHYTSHSNGTSTSNIDSTTSYLSHSKSLTTTVNSKSQHLTSNSRSVLSPLLVIRPIDVVVFSLSIIVFPFIPASNMFFYVGFVIAERILYIPSMGVCLLVGLGLDIFYKRSQSSLGRMFILSALAVLTLTFSAKTVLRNLDWQTEERLYTSGISINPAKAWGNLANIYNDKQQIDKAEQAYKTALTFRPNMADVHYNLGVLMQNQNRINEATDRYKKAIHFRPKLSVAYLNLGILTAQQGDTEQAKQIYRHCADLDTSGLKDPRLHDGTKISCIFNHGRVLMDEDKLQEALELFHIALQRRPEHYQPQSIYNMIGEVYFKMDEVTQAEKWYREALTVKPDHLPAYLTMSKLKQRQGLLEEAENWLDQAKEHNPTDLTIDFYRAQLMATKKQYEDAINIFERILPNMSQDFEIVYNAANVYREADKKQKAEELYIAASKLKPNEPAAWMNLGAMLHINSKYQEAERAYLRGLKLRPNDKVTRENLQRLRQLMNKKK
uniref:dolichyl-phosphate-mannose--protein mannosyltransferase n=1 Tax=Arion vulgaris TaxID=1028688 RepID=A0A0B7A7K4_9EUPU